MRKYKKTLFFGYVIHDVSKLTGIAYAVVWRNANNKNSISPKNAKIYYEKLGIPLYQLRPDLWTKEMCDTLQTQAQDTAENKQGEW